MAVIVPAKSTRERIVPAVGFSILIPGLGHYLAGRKKEALYWFFACQITLLLGMMLAGHTQNDYGFPFKIGDATILFVLLPECGNFLVTQIVTRMYESIEAGGSAPTDIPWRQFGYLLSGMSGVLGMFSAAHASGCVIADNEKIRSGQVAPKIHPGKAALLTLLLPGLGHWVTGRRFKAYLLGCAIIGLFLLGMTLGGFGDFDRQRHPYYWAGQMMLGGVGWLTSALTSGVYIVEHKPYIDAGLLFTTSAGFFNVIAALDAFHRAEQDWLAVGAQVEVKAASGPKGAGGVPGAGPGGITGAGGGLKGAGGIPGGAGGTPPTPDKQGNQS